MYTFKNDLIKDMNLLQKDPSIVNQEKFIASKHELEQIEKHEAYGYILRAKSLWTEDGEKNSKFFLNLEKKNYCNKLITSLEVDGNIIKDQKNIAQAQKNFYQNLYSEKLNSSDASYNESLNNFLKNNKTRKLTNAEKDSCEQPITEKEILIALKQLHNGKTPGTDGLPPDFYKFFWLDIKSLLIESIEFAIVTGELSVEQKRGIITLLSPKNKTCHLLKNWRPISLLNTDYK